MDLKGRKIAILVAKMYEDLELWYPYYRLKEAGAEVHLIGAETGHAYESKHGYPAKSDEAADDVSVDDYDALVIPGGYSPDHMRRSPAMIQLTREMFESGKPVAAICHGPWMLASAGVLEGRKMTSFFSIKDDVVNAGADWVDQEVVRDENLITSRSPDDLPAFCRTLIEAVSESEITRPQAKRRDAKHERAAVRH